VLFELRSVFHSGTMGKACVFRGGDGVECTYMEREFGCNDMRQEVVHIACSGELVVDDDELLDTV
jgi:hypothetical protein